MKINPIISIFFVFIIVNGVFSHTLLDLLDTQFGDVGTHSGKNMRSLFQLMREEVKKPTSKLKDLLDKELDSSSDTIPKGLFEILKSLLAEAVAKAAYEVLAKAVAEDAEPDATVLEIQPSKASEQQDIKNESSFDDDEESDSNQDLKSSFKDEL